MCFLEPAVSKTINFTMVFKKTKFLKKYQRKTMLSNRYICKVVNPKIKIVKTYTTLTGFFVKLGL